MIACYTFGDATPQSGKKGGRPEAAQKAIFSSSDSNSCGGCHQSYVESMKNAKTLVNKHSAIAKDCFTCHKKPSLETAHADTTKTPGKLIRERKYPNDLCLNCHHVSYDQLVEKTKESKAFKTVDGTVINPHDTHVGRVECYNCHKMHKEKQPIEYCYGCHHTRQLNNCKDCHARK